MCCLGSKYSTIVHILSSENPFVLLLKSRINVLIYACRELKIVIALKYSIKIRME